MIIQHKPNNIKPLASVIVTYFNSDSLGNFIHKSMDYLLKQTYKILKLFLKSISFDFIEPLLNADEILKN